jgi:outer membrane immunogenic protein
MRFLWVGVLGVALASPALAQDYNWSGLYLGAHGGYAWGEHEGTGTYTDPTWAPCATGCKVLDPEKGSIDLEGGLGGGQIGFNLQRGAFVFGLEGDASWLGADGEGTFISDYDNANGTNQGGDGTTDYTWNIKTEMEWLATLRGRVGVLVSPRLLVYGTGGIAWAGLSSDETVTGFAPQGFNPPQTTVLASSSETATGWVAGAGAEWAFAPNWSLKSEWQHIQFDDLDTKFVGTAYPGAINEIKGYANDSFPGSLSVDVIKVGVNYRFGEPAPAIAPLK